MKSDYEREMLLKKFENELSICVGQVPRMPPLLFWRKDSNFFAKNKGDVKPMMICHVDPETGNIFNTTYGKKPVANVNQPWRLTSCLRIEQS